MADSWNAAGSRYAGIWGVVSADVSWGRYRGTDQSQIFLYHSAYKRREELGGCWDPKEGAGEMFDTAQDGCRQQSTGRAQRHQRQ